MKKTVTIGIAAYNEGKNIGYLLDSILSQRRDGYVLDHIIIVSDCSTDDTVRVVRKYQAKNPIITLIVGRERMGQIARLNQIYKMNTSDIIVNFDADATLAHNSVILEIVKQFERQSVGLVAANDQPLPAETLFGRIVETHIKLWYETRRDINGGDTLHNNHGCAFAISRDLGRFAAMPPDMMAQDMYIYLRAKELGMKFRYAEKAVVFYRAPQTFGDFWRQAARFEKTKDNLYAHFGGWIDAYMTVPLAYKLRALACVAAIRPFSLPFAILLRPLAVLGYLRLRETIRGNFWEPVASTKDAHRRSI